MAMTRTQEAWHEFAANLNTAIEAAHIAARTSRGAQRRRRVQTVNHYLRMAHEDAWHLGWSQCRERFFAAQNECIAVLGARND